MRLGLAATAVLASIAAAAAGCSVGGSGDAADGASEACFEGRENIAAVDFEAGDRREWSTSLRALGDAYRELHEKLAALEPAGDRWTEFLAGAEAMHRIRRQMADALDDNRQQRVADLHAELDLVEAESTQIAARLGLLGCGRSDPRPTPSANPNRDLPPALTAAAPKLSARQATAIVKAWWPLREDALGYNDLAALERIETGSALRSDRARVVNLVGRGSISDGAVHPAKEIRLILPRGDHSYFLAQVLTTARPSNLDPVQPREPWVELVSFERTDASMPWRAAHISGHPPRGKAGFDGRLQGAGQGAQTPDRDPKTSFTDLASYYQSWATARSAPAAAAFRPGIWTEQLGSEISTTPNGELTEKGLVLTLSYSPDPAAASAFTYPLRGGARLNCGTTSGRRLYRSPQARGAVVQDADRSNWGGSLPPGLYRSVRETIFRETCILEPPGSTGVRDVVASRGTKLEDGERIRGRAGGSAGYVPPETPPPDAPGRA